MDQPRQKVGDSVRGQTEKKNLTGKMWKLGSRHGLTFGIDALERSAFVLTALQSLYHIPGESHSS